MVHGESLQHARSGHDGRGQGQGLGADPGHQQHPSVASDAQRNLVVVWETEEEDGRFDVMAQRYASRTCPAGPTTLCLGGGRFPIEVTGRVKFYTNPLGEFGSHRDEAAFPEH